MQLDGTFHLLAQLGSCQVGSVWSAVDAQGRSLTVAVLDAAVAADQRWRDAFASRANALGQGENRGAGQVYADFSGTTPWVACAAGDGPGAEQVFLDLGMDYQPVPPEQQRPAEDSPRPDESAGGPSVASVLWPKDGLQPVSGSPGPSLPQPTSISPATPISPVSPEPVLVGPQPVSGVPQSPAVGPLPPTIDPPQPTPHPYVPEYLKDSGYPPLFPTAPAKRRRTGLWIAIAVVVALAAAGGVYAWQRPGGTPTVTGSSSPQPVAMPSTPALKPGIEPPRPGDWPRWPSFAEADQVRTLDLDGLGFPLTVPATWECNGSGLADGYVKYQCGDNAHKDLQIGGELIVRECQPPCDENQRAERRKTEEAWGLQWRQGGPNAVLAETLQLNGASRYGLVFMAFWPSTPGGPIDRELVFRMTSPVDWLDTLRRTANAIRDRTGF